MKTVIGSVLAATGASICCIGPVLLSVVGVGAMGAAAPRFEAYRPMLLTITAALLASARAYSWYARDVTSRITTSAGYRA